MNKISLVLALLALMLICSSAQAVVYDASLGSLPSAQDWNLQNTGGSPNPTVNNGAISQGLTSSWEYFYWKRTDESRNFLTGTTVLETSLKIGQSIYTPNPPDGSGWRTSFSISLSDDSQRQFIIGIAGNGIRICNSDWDIVGSSAFYAVDTTTAFNTYRFTIENGVGNLLMNGQSILTLAVGNVLTEYPTHWITWGDGTHNGGSSYDLTYLSCTSVPEPSSLFSLLGGATGFIGMVFARRRNICNVLQTTGEKG